MAKPLQRNGEAMKNSACNLCTLCTNVNSVCLWGEGPSSCDIMVIGREPGIHDDKTGRPLSEPGLSELLDSWLIAAGLERSDVYVSNMCKCQTPSNRRPTKEEIDACRIYLDQEIAAVQPKVIITLGGDVLEAFTGQTQMMKLAGKTFNITNKNTGFKCKIFASVAPSYVYRNAGYKDRVLKQFTAFGRELRGEVFEKSAVKYITVETIEQFRKFMAKMRAQKIIVFDTETTGFDFLNDRILCYSFSWKENTAVVLPLLGYKEKAIWTEEELLEINTALKEIYADPAITWIAQNISFDIKFLKAAGIECAGPIEDTMLLQTLVDENATDLKGLKAMADFYTDMGNYDAPLDECKKQLKIEKRKKLIDAQKQRKDRIKELKKMLKKADDTTTIEINQDIAELEGELEDLSKISKDITYADIPTNILWPYAAMDADATMRIFHILMKKLREEAKLYAHSHNMRPHTQMVRYYKRLVMRQRKVLDTMEYRGAKVDIEYLHKLDKKYTQKLHDLEQSFFAMPEVAKTCEKLLRKSQKKAEERYKKLKTVIDYESGATDKKPKFTQKAYGIHYGKPVPFNMNSHDHLRILLFDVLKLVHPFPEKTGKAGLSTDKEVLNALEDKHDCVAMLQENRKLSKLHKTYVRGQIKRADANDRIHTNFNQHIAVTGRLSCLKEDTPIVTSRGSILIKDIVAGDSVSTQYGMRKVLKTYSGKDTLYKLIVNGRNIYVTSKHKFLTAAGKFVEARKLNVGDIICGTTKFDNFKEFGTSKDIQEAEFLGYIVGDEHIRKGYKNLGGRIMSVDAARRIGKLGVAELSHNAVVPEWIYTSSTLIMSAFLRGLFEANGWVNDQRNMGREKSAHIGFCSVSENLANGAARLLDCLGIRTRKGHTPYPQVKSKSGIWKLYITGAMSKKRFAEKIGFFSEKKTKKLKNILISISKRKDAQDTFYTGINHNVCLGNITNQQSISRAAVADPVTNGAVKLTNFIENSQYHVKIDSIEKLSGTYNICDIMVEDVSQYTVQGLICHNSSDPNLQNIPRANKDIKKAFIPTKKDWSIVQMDYCVPLNAQILTKRGFVSYDKLVIGEEVLGYNAETAQCEWTILEDIHTFSNTPMRRIYNKGFEFLASPNHKWAGYTPEGHTAKWTTNDLIGNDRRLIVSAPAEGGDHSLTPREAAILGWIVTDGHISWMGSRGTSLNTFIYQSPKKYAKEIKKLLGKDLQSENSAIGGYEKPVKRFRLFSQAARDLFKKAQFENLKDLLKLIPRLSKNSRAAMLDAMIKAKGSTTTNQRGYKSSRWHQKPGPVLDAFILLATLEGKRLSGFSTNPETGTITLTVSKRHTLQTRLLRIDKVSSTNSWCPQTKLGTWVSKLGNQVSITSNSQAEFRMWAELSNDVDMINDIKSGLDIHRATAAQFWGISEDQVSKDQRSAAKFVVFGLMYGRGAESVAKQVKITTEAAETIINQFFAKYPVAHRWLKYTKKFAESRGFSPGYFGRVRRLPYACTRHIDRQKWGEAMRQSVNAPIQGGAADLTGIAMIKIYAELQAHPEWRAHLTLTVHDSIILEVHKDDLAPVIAMCHQKMTENVDNMKVPMAAEIEIGPHWGDLIEISTKDISASLKKYFNRDKQTDTFEDNTEHVVGKDHKRGGTPEKRGKVSSPQKQMGSND